MEPLPAASPLNAARLVGRTLVGAVGAGAATFVLTAVLSLPVAGRLVLLVRGLPSSDTRALLGGFLSTAGMWVAAPLVAVALTRLTDMRPVLLGVVQALVAVAAVLLVDLAALGMDGPLLGGSLFLGSRLAGYAVAVALSVVAARFGAAQARAAAAADDELRRLADEERRRLLDVSVALADKIEARRAGAAEAGASAAPLAAAEPAASPAPAASPEPAVSPEAAAPPAVPTDGKAE